MTRALFYLRRATVCLLLCALACVDSSTLTPTLRRPGARPDAPHVVVVRSSMNRLFDAPLQAFLDHTDLRVTVYSLDSGDAAGAQALISKLDAQAPQLVFTLGTRATELVAAGLPRTTVVFTMVVNYRRLKLAGRSDVMGVALEPSPTSEFSQFRMIAPNLERVLVFFNPRESQSFVDQAAAELKGLGITLTAVPVQGAADVQRELPGRIGAVDGVWLISDPVLMNQATFEYLRDQAIAHKKPFVTSFSEGFARAGALASVSTDFPALGSQVAAMARQHLEQGVAAKEIGVQLPISSALVVNLGVARRIGLAVPEEVLPFIDVLLSE